MPPNAPSCYIQKPGGGRVNQILPITQAINQTVRRAARRTPVDQEFISMAAVRRPDGQILTKNVQNKQMHIKNMQDTVCLRKEQPCGTPISHKVFEELNTKQFQEMCTLLDFSKSNACTGELIRSPQYAGLVHIPINFKDSRSPQPAFKSYKYTFLWIA
jgi:hypothetical protein